MNANIRHRTAAKHDNDSGSGSAYYNIRDDNHRNGDSKRHHTALHTGVWARLFSIVGLFTLVILILSKIGKSTDVGVNGGGIRVGGGTSTKSSTCGGGGSPSYVTVVMPSVVKPQARPLRLTNIAKTWGPSSNAIYVVHGTEEYSEGKQIGKATTYPQNLVVPKNITVDKGVERLEHVIRTVHKDINPDFAFFVNDHTFVLPDHLCLFLKGHDSSKDLYVGHALKGKEESSAFNSGAAGYVLSRSTMEKLIREWDNPSSKCSAANASKWLQGNPGILTAQCFDKVLHIPVVDTRDNDLTHRFHAYGIVRTVTGKVDDWYMNKHKSLESIFGEDQKYHHILQRGVNCCSRETISFHYVEAGESLPFWEVLLKIHQSPTMSDEEIKELMNKVWPRDKEGLGGYGHALPGNNDAVWTDMIQVVRKIAV